MALRSLGPCAVAVSPIALGTVKFGRNTGVKYPHRFELPSDRDIRELLALARDLGVQTLDTAPAYGSSEERLGQLLETPADWTLITKVGEQFDGVHSHFDFSAQATRSSIETSLRRLRREQLDVVLLHSDGDDLRIIEQEAAIETLITLRDAGLIRALGLSSKTVAGGLWSIEHLDCVMATLNPLAQQELPVFQAAADAGKGVLVKKALQSGHGAGANGVRDALQLAFKTAGTASVVIGTLSQKHLRDNLTTASEILATA